MLTFEPLGIPELLPALVVGYQLTDEAVLTDVAGAPGWMLRLDQQAGGFAVSHLSVLGAVLRLEANVARGHHDADALVRGLKALGESAEPAAPEQFPALRGFAQTSGKPYDAEALRQLSGHVGAHFDVPPFEWGLEAFVRCVDVEPLVWRGWRVLTCRVADGAKPFPGNAIDDYTFGERRGDLLLADDLIFDEGIAGQLRDIGRAIARHVAGKHSFKPEGLDHLEREPRTFLLWENSD
jgi:hypothetical protein